MRVENHEAIDHLCLWRQMPEGPVVRRGDVVADRAT